MNAEYAEGAEQSPYLELDTQPQAEQNENKIDDDFELDASKVCQIDDPDCEACQ